MNQKVTRIPENGDIRLLICIIKNIYFEYFFHKIPVTILHLKVFLCFRFMSFPISKNELIVSLIHEKNEIISILNIGKRHLDFTSKNNIYLKEQKYTIHHVIDYQKVMNILKERVSQIKGSLFKIFRFVSCLTQKAYIYIGFLMNTV